MKQTPIRKVSKKMATQKQREDKLTQWLLGLCGWLCEIHNGPPTVFGLSKHEIIFRSRGGDALDPLNCLIRCHNCHSHVKYPKTGTPLSTEEQLEIARERCTE